MQCADCLGAVFIAIVLAVWIAVGNHTGVKTPSCTDNPKPGEMRMTAKRRGPRPTTKIAQLARIAERAISAANKASGIAFDAVLDIRGIAQDEDARTGKQDPHLRRKPRAKR